MAKTAVIIGAGPAGLTAAYELLEKTDVHPVVFEMDTQVGGISKTIEYKGNRIDIGGHRFFTKSDPVLRWWLDILPLEKGAGSYEGFPASALDPETTDAVMLIRTRMSRIYYLRSFFDYPITLTPQTLRKLGFGKAFRIGLSYLRSLAFPIRDVQNIEQLLINRFGRELYTTFFKSYTEKVWGVPADQISAEWGVQRIKDLSVSRAVINALTRKFRGAGGTQKTISTSLVERFLYPKFGPGQLWDEVARRVTQRGGEVHLRHRVAAVHTQDHRVTGVEVEDVTTGARRAIEADYLFSTMPVRDLVAALDAPIPDDIRRIAEGLLYRDFMSAGLLVRRLKVRNDTAIPTPDGAIPDTWIYVQEPEVKLARLQIFNNWNRYMVHDPEHTVWLSLEYFCNEGDVLWVQPDSEFLAFAIDELARVDIIDKADVLDGVVIHMKKAYPAYVGAYERFDALRACLDRFENLFLIGRNGMHRYNNQDHSMLTAMTAVDNLRRGVVTKDTIWDVNTEQEYHENK